MSERRLLFEVSAPGGRLDHFLVKCVPEHSRNRLQQLIRQEMVTVDDAVVTKSGFRLDGGEQVEIVIPAPVPTDLLFDNDDSMWWYLLFEYEIYLQNFEWKSYL